MRQVIGMIATGTFGLKVTLVLGAMSVGFALTAQAQMSIPGQLSVNQTGAATYTIPIQVPPGVAGMEPKLALAYNSQTGNGLVGVGWNLSGLSAITRCPQTSAQDGPNWVGGINYALTDRYCLDGQRLVNIPNPTTPGATTPGSYGADQTYYSTERESFSQVQSFGSVGGVGPSYFIVKTKAGLTMEYGNTTSSKVMATNGSASLGVVRVWALNKMTDVFGNYMTVTYQDDAAGGQYYPIYISYTGNAGSSPALSPKFQVNLYYENRPDVAPKYQAGGIAQYTQRLSKIVTTDIAISTTILTYAISYSAAFPETVDSFVANVNKCDSANNCVMASQFNLATPAGLFADSLLGTGGGSGYWPGWSGPSSQPFIFTGDFNGDGKTDLMYWNNAGWTIMTQQGGVWVGANWGHGTGTGYWVSFAYTTAQPFQFTGDFNGDGKTDFMYWNGSGWTVLLANSTGTGFTEQNWGKGSGSGFWVDFRTGSQPFQMTGDFDGDGKTDFMYWNGAGWTVLLSTGSGWREVNFGKGNGSGYWLGYMGSSTQRFHFTGDFNGDGKTDFMYWNGSGWTVLLSTGSGWVESNWGKGNSNGLGYWASYTSGSQQFQLTGDFNGDGKTDFMYWDGGGWRVLLSTGSGWDDKYFGKGAGVGYWPSYLQAATQSFQFAGDFNGDGKTDFLYWNGSGWNALLSTGTGWVEQNLGAGSGRGYWRTYTSGSQPFQFTGDFNGDGKTDLMYWDDSQWRALTNGGSRVLSSINNGLGMFAAISYATPAQLSGTRYTQSAPAVDPQVAFAPTWPVVSDIDKSNGIGGTNRTSYWYDSAVTEISTGRGFSGFNYIQSQDVTTGLVARTTWRRDFPFAGQVDQTAKGSSLATWNDLGQTFNQYVFNNFSGNCLSQPGMRYFVYANQVDSINNKDLTASGQPGSGLPGSRTNQLLDNWGSSTSMVVQVLNADNSASGYNKVTSNTFGNDTTNWFLGRLLTSTTVSSSGAALISNPVTGCISVGAGTGGDANGGRRTIMPVPPGTSR